MKIKILLIFLIFIILTSGCIDGSKTVSKQKHELTEVYVEDRNVDSGEKTRIFFEARNNADTTLLSIVEVEVDENCFSKPYKAELDSLPPNSATRSYVYLKTKTSYGADDTQCVGGIFKVTVLLKDINGKLLDTEQIEVGIV